jgi:hypothetical protein
MPVLSNSIYQERASERLSKKGELMQFGMNQLPLDERRANTEPGAIATGGPVRDAYFDLKVVDSINQLICTCRY